MLFATHLATHNPPPACILPSLGGGRADTSPPVELCSRSPVPIPSVGLLPFVPGNQRGV